MADWLLESGIVYLLGVALIPGVGLLLVCWGVWGDRSKGRSRCPKCWYDMRGTVPKLTCPECGHDAGQERRLHKSHTQVTDAGLAHLKALSQLRQLALNETQVTDAGLTHLNGLTRLSRLDLSGTQVTDAGVAKLKQALPNVRVYRKPGAIEGRVFLR